MSSPEARECELVVTPTLPDDVTRNLQHLQSLFVPVAETMQKIGTRISGMLTDPKNRCGMALVRKQVRDRANLDGNITRLGRAYLDTMPLDTMPDSPTDTVMTRLAPALLPQRHKNTAERVTCLRSPRAHLHAVAA
jgi:hypothetical protein